MMWALLALTAWGQEVPAPYTAAVALLRDHYLFIDEVDPLALLEDAAIGLERGVDWLEVDPAGGRVDLRHAGGRKLGRIEVTGWDDLAAGLFALEDNVRAAGYAFGDVDLRLTVLAGMTTDLDPYSRVLAGDKLESFDTRTRGTLVGIGAGLRRTDGFLRITQVNAGGPAERAGLQGGDTILRIDGVATTNMTINDAVQRIRGDQGTVVRLQVQRGTRTWELDLARDKVVLDNVLSEVLADQIGYVRITNVSEQTVPNLTAALARLREAGALERGLVIDLRGNTGGSMIASARAVDAFVEQGLLLTTQGRGGAPVEGLTQKLVARDGGDEPGVGIVVLVDPKTASGAEIISGALQQLGRAVVVGQRTFGKGLVQKLYPLDQDLKFKLTVAEYVLADELHVADVGVQPDLHVGHIIVGTDTVRFSGWDAAREHVGWQQIVPAVTLSGRAAEVVAEDAGVDVLASADRDTLRDLARRALVAADGAGRDALLAALDRVQAEVRAEQGRRLAVAFADRGLDWTPAPGDGALPEVKVSLVATPDPADPDLQIVTATVVNLGATPLHQALLRLSCASTSAWDELVVPVGLVPSGSTATGEVRVRLQRDIGPRHDAVAVELRSDRRPALLLPPAVLSALSIPDPRLRVSARLRETPQGLVAEVTVRNLSDLELEGLEASFEAPEVAGVELVDAAWHEPKLGAGKEVTFRLGLRRAAGAPDELPLALVISADHHGTLFRPKLPLHVSGDEVVREAPQVVAEGLPLSHAVGKLVFTAEVTDDSQVDGVVVFHNGEKLLWDDGGLSRVKVRATLELEPGVNLITVLATDDDGTRTQEVLRVLGLGGDGAVEAGGGGEWAPPPPKAPGGRPG
jgi:C-terminal peptidase prc